MGIEKNGAYLLMVRDGELGNGADLSREALIGRLANKIGKLWVK